MKPSQQQVGGDHYKSFAIQPAEFIHRNAIGFLEGNIIKYVCRHAAKNGKADLLKARHYIDLLIEWEYEAHASGELTPADIAAGILPDHSPKPNQWTCNKHGYTVCAICGPPPKILAEPCT